MPTPSANITQTPISGKFGRVFLYTLNAGGAGTQPGPVNFRKSSIDPHIEDLDTTGFEDGGWANGLGGIAKADVNFEGPFQILRTGAQAPYQLILHPGAFFVYEIYTVHPDYGSAGGLHRYTGVAQVIGFPAEIDASLATTNTIRGVSRGPIYFPGYAAPSVAVMLAGFVGIATNAM